MTHEKSQLPNWTGLLGWSTTHHDGTSASQLGPMDSERRQWLEKALDSAFGGQEDPNALIQKAVEEIKDGRVSAGLDMLDFASDILESVENIDKLGGLKVLIDLIENDSPDTIVRASSVLHLYLSNNPRAQIAAAVKYDLMAKLKNAIGIYRNSVPVLHGVLSTFGALVRNVEVLEKSFINQGYAAHLVELTEEISDSSCVHKVVALIAYLMADHTDKVLDLADRLVVRVYGSGVFDINEIQFWETCSRMFSFGGMKDRHRNLLDNRINTIQRTSNPLDFEQELEILQQ